MHRQLIAGAFVCFGSSLFGQIIDRTANEAQGTLNNIQNNLQDGVQKAQNTLDGNVQQDTGASVLRDGQNQTSVNGQNQTNGAFRSDGGAAVQSNTNLQNNSNRQPGQLNANASSQIQGQSNSGVQQRGNGIQNPSNQPGSIYEANRNNGTQTQATQGQAVQGRQPSNDGPNAGINQNNVNQNNGTLQNGTVSQLGSSAPMTNWQQSSSTQNSGRVYLLRHDANGREFICVDGRMVYFDNANSVSAQGNQANQDQYRSGYGNYDSQNSRNSENSVRENGQKKGQQQGSQVGQNAANNGNSPLATDPSNSGTMTNGEFNSKKPDQASLNNSTEAKKGQNASGVQTDLDANAEVNRPSVNSTDFTPPKL